MFESAAEESFPMPATFERQVNEILAKAKSQKNTTTIRSKIKAYFTGPNVWSLAGGGAVYLRFDVDGNPGLSRFANVVVR